MNASASVRQRVDDLISCIRQGKIIEAMNEFYDENTCMQENLQPATIGLAANIEREKQFLSYVKEWKRFEVLASAVEGNVAFIESTIDFIAVDGKDAHMVQTSVQRWQNGKIISERFYYDPTKG